MVKPMAGCTLSPQIRLHYATKSKAAISLTFAFHCKAIAALFFIPTLKHPLPYPIHPGAQLMLLGLVFPGLLGACVEYPSRSFSHTNACSSSHKKLSQYPDLGTPASATTHLAPKKSARRGERCCVNNNNNNNNTTILV